MNAAGYEVRVESNTERPRVVEQLRRDNWFVLDTCQRLEVFGHGNPGDIHGAEIIARWTAAESFERLVRIAAGLESRVLGELEVLGQVRNAYKCFRERTGGDLADLDRMFQDVLALARKARRESGIARDLTSLSGLAAREMLDRVGSGNPVAVVGSGALAKSVVRYLGKRGNSPVRVAGRCPDKAMSLALTAGGFGASLDDLSHLLDGACGVISATAAPHPVLFPHHLERAADPLLVIDLGEPPDCCGNTQADPRVNYLGLRDIEERANGNRKGRAAAAEIAGRIIQDGTLAWCAGAT